MKKIRIIADGNGKWYKCGEVYVVKDELRYAGIGVQVYKEGNGHVPDVVMDADYEILGD